MVVIPAPLRVIGVVRSSRSSLENTPIQAALNRAERGFVEFDPHYAEGLAGLEGFDYAWLLTWLHKPDETVDDDPPLKQVPFLLRGTDRQVGVFATRGPRRVNPVGLSLIQLVEVTEGTVEFAGVDVIDGTPVIDLKPYVGRFDRPPTEPRCGWFDDLSIADGVMPSTLGKPDS
jgi:tRNA-Thr(GGU) m(6)t(6)A37 methyltransferase TsaA